MPVVDVRMVRVRMHLRLVLVPVTVRLSGGIGGPVPVLVMFIVDV